jgi:hypothetical protein
MITELLKNNADMLSMLFFSHGEDKNIINEDHNKNIKLIKEDRVHQLHEICQGIG